MLVSPLCVISANDYASYADFLALSEKSFLIPALAEKMVPQGMDIWEERGWLMISGYFDDASTSDCSVLVAVDMKTGAYVGEYYLTNADGTPHTSHAGGIFLKIGRIGNDKVDAQHIVIGKSETAVNYDNVVAVFNHGDVFSDFSDTSERNNFKLLFFCHKYMITHLNLIYKSFSRIKKIKFE